MTFMTPEIRNILIILDLSRMVEFALAEFYSACAEYCPETAESWRDIAHQERQHARYILRIVNLVVTKPEEFKRRERVNPDAIFDFFHGVESDTQKVFLGKRDRTALPFVAAGFESAVVEKRFYDLLDSQNIEYNELVQLIQEESIGHRVTIRGNCKTSALSA